MTRLITLFVLGSCCVSLAFGQVYEEQLAYSPDQIAEREAKRLAEMNAMNALDDAVMFAAPHAPDRLIVGFAPLGEDAVAQAAVADTARDLAVETLEELGLRPIRLLPRTLRVDRVRGAAARGPVYVVSVPEEIGLAQARAWLLAEPPVEYVHPDYVVFGMVEPNDPSYPLQWGFPQIDAPLAWDITTGNTGVEIAVIDSGVDLTHVDLTGNMDLGYAWDYVGDDDTPNDQNGHGTHVFGTVAAVTNNSTDVAGMCWTASITPLRILDANNNGLTSDSIAAITLAINNGAHAINASYGGGSYNTAEYDAIADGDILADWTIFVAAAGNDAQSNDSTPHYPSSYDLDNIIAVAATTTDDTLWYDGPGDGSNWGPTSVDVAAPGHNIRSTWLGGGDGEMTGTSMATPHVTGLCGLIFTERSHDYAVNLRDRIMLSADRISALSGLIASGGRINAWKALVTDEFVDPDEPPGGDGEPSTPHDTLTAAVNDADPGDHILLVPGSYDETPTITKRVTLISTGSAKIGQ